VRLQLGPGPVRPDDAVTKDYVDNDDGAGFPTMSNQEVPGGAIDGVNAEFTLAHLPIAGSEMVYVNGLMQASGEDNDYLISGETITFIIAPPEDTRILATYWFTA
jgi:hypothetical protein